MDGATAEVFRAAGVKLRQFSPVSRKKEKSKNKTSLLLSPFPLFQLPFIRVYIGNPLRLTPINFSP